MGLVELLERRKADIVKQWFDNVMNSYPPDTAQFYKGQKDPFANPVGAATRLGLSEVFNEILGNMDRNAIAASLDTIVRIRAIQNFTPSSALAFILELKKILRKTFQKEIKNKTFGNSDMDRLESWFMLEERIDQLGLIAFDVYMKCREKIYELKVSTERDKTYKAFARAGLITEAIE